VDLLFLDGERVRVALVGGESFDEKDEGLGERGANERLQTL
jgi:hypothetical protein